MTWVFKYNILDGSQMQMSALHLTFKCATLTTRVVDREESRNRWQSTDRSPQLLSPDVQPFAFLAPPLKAILKGFSPSRMI